MEEKDKVQTVSGEEEAVKEKPKTSRKKRVSKTARELDKLKAENASLQEQLLRKVAEFDNYKKRTDRETLMLIQNANERLILQLLPVIDDFERSMAHAQQAKDVKSLAAGFELIVKKLITTLEKQGLKKMEVVGEEFDPEKHEALMQMEKEGTESGVIIDEHLKGYLLNDKVLRHAQVLVAK